MNASSRPVEEVLETGKSKASGSIFVGIDANCNIDDSGDQRGLLVRELRALHNLLPLFQRFLDVGMAVSDRCDVEKEGRLLFDEPGVRKS